MTAEVRSPVASLRAVVEARRLFDGQRFVEPARVVLAAGLVEAVGADVAEPTTVNLGDVTLLPRLVDCHRHLVFDGVGTFEEQVSGRTDEELAARARTLARRALEGGVTTLRDLGDRNFVTLGLRGDPDLPTILCAGPPITAVKGHCWFLGGECADREALLAAVRRIWIRSPTWSCSNGSLVRASRCRQHSGSVLMVRLRRP